MSPFDVAIGPHRLPGQLCLPPDPRGLILFAHGSGSSRFSPRNQFVAEAFQRGAFATLLFDLLHENEAEDRHNVFDIGLLGSRVVEAIDWTQKDDRTFALPLGLFGASTGAAAALAPPPPGKTSSAQSFRAEEGRTSPNPGWTPCARPRFSSSAATTGRFLPSTAPRKGSCAAPPN